MQTWQQQALAAWPEYHQDIHEAYSPSELWLTLWDTFVAVSYGLRDEAALRCFYAYAWWSLDHSESTASAAVLHFYERLPDYARIREEMHHYLSIEQFDRIKESWRYGRSNEEYTALLRDLQNFREGKPLVNRVLPKHAFKGISARNKP
ncbi:MAG TPA: hypothetical protein VKT25_13500 [Ktedonobacteraceae bacterium]|nr:hypothetical protein [Ktedonobacteraceae bacterium]